MLKRLQSLSFALFITLIAFFFQSEKVYAQQSPCAQYIGSCQYYACQDAQFSCIDDNYFYDYGYRNCLALTTDYFLSRLSPQGIQWLHEAKLCLQEDMETFYHLRNKTKPEKKLCKKNFDDAFNAHSICYYKAGFCELGIGDRFRVLEKLKAEAFSWRSWKEYLQLEAGCIRGNPMEIPSLQDSY